jgi:hypothetical protein
MSTRRSRRARRLRRGDVRLPLRKDVETPPPGLVGRPGVIRYWMRRPEPGEAFSALASVGFLAGAIHSHTWGLVPGAVVMAGVVGVTWYYRESIRWNADRWRQGYHDAN